VDLTIPNCGIQEDADPGWPELIQEVFPGAGTMKKAYMYINDAPGIGVDIDETLAAKYPFPPWPKGTGFGFPVRKSDGAQIRRRPVLELYIAHMAPDFEYRQRWPSQAWR
jgi:mannonate dehydratase